MSHGPMVHLYTYLCDGIYRDLTIILDRGRMTKPLRFTAERSGNRPPMAGEMQLSQRIATHRKGKLARHNKDNDDGALIDQFLRFMTPCHSRAPVGVGTGPPRMHSRHVHVSPQRHLSPHTQRSTSSMVAMVGVDRVVAVMGVGEKRWRRRVGRRWRDGLIGGTGSSELQ